MASPLHHIVGIIATVTVVAGLVSSPGRSAADDIVIAAWNAVPQAGTEISGREVEIIRHVMGQCGHEVRFATFPFTRHWIAFLQGSVDAVATVPGHLALDLPGTRTLSYINHENGFLVRGTDGLQIDGFEDLEGLRIVSFAGAHTLLPEVAAIADIAESYVEVGDLSEQLALLLTNRIDAVYGDGRFLAEAVRQIRSRSATRNRLNGGQPLRFFPVAASPPFHMVFRRRGLAHDFNRCLTTASLAGEVDAIIAQYDEQQAAMFPASCGPGGFGTYSDTGECTWLAPAAGFSPAGPNRDAY